MLQWRFDGPLSQNQQFLVMLRTEANQRPQEWTAGQTPEQNMIIQFDKNPGFFKDDNTTFFWNVVAIGNDGQPRSRPSDESSFVLRTQIASPSTPETPTPTREPPPPEPEATPRS